MPDLLVGYTYDTNLSRYRSNATGRFVGRDNILGLLRNNIDANRTNLADITRAYHEGRLSGAAWMEESRTILRRLHLQNSALGSGGFDRLGAREFGRIGGRIRGDYAGLQRLHDAVRAGEASLPQALQRVEGLVGNARRDFWDAEREHRQRSAPNVVIIERNILAAGAQHCADCVDLYERGWQLAGVIPVPGTDRICGFYCRCILKSREVPANEVGEWLNTKR